MRLRNKSQYEWPLSLGVGNGHYWKVHDELGGLIGTDGTDDELQNYGACRFIIEFPNYDGQDDGSVVRLRTEERDAGYIRYLGVGTFGLIASASWDELQTFRLHEGDLDVLSFQLIKGGWPDAWLGRFDGGNLGAKADKDGSCVFHPI